MCSGGARDQRVRGMDGPTLSSEVGLVLAGTSRRLSVGRQEAKGIEERSCSLSFSRSETSFDLGDVHACRCQGVPLPQTMSEIRCDGRGVSEVPDQHGRVQDVDGQDASSV